MKIRTKLLVGFVSVAVLCGVVGVLGIIQLGNLETSLSNNSVNYIPTIVAINNVQTQLYAIDAAVRSLANPSGLLDDNYIQMEKKNLADARAIRDEAIKRWEGTSNTPEEQRLWDTFKSSLPAAAAYNDSIVALVDKYRKTPSQVAVAAVAGRNAPVAAATASERDSIVAQIYELVSGDKRAIFEDMMAKAQKVADYDQKYYGEDVPKAAVASAAQAISVVVVFTVIAFGVAIALGLMLGSSIAKALGKTVRHIDMIAKGDVSERMETGSKDEFGLMAVSVNKLEDNIAALIADAGMLVTAAIEGRLATRADVSKHQGDYRKIVEGVNKTLDSVIGPLNVTARYVEDISKGVIPPMIVETYNGDFNVIKNNLNTVVKMMSDLLKETDVIIKAAADGELDKRANAGLFLGGWNQLVKGVNDTITNIVDPLNVTADYVDKVSKGVIPPEITTVYKGQYNVIKTNLNNMVRMMSELLAETDKIVKAAADGALDTRADAAKFVGGWNKLVAGINDTITNIVDPLMVTADYVDKVAKGVIPPEITTVYKGQYNLIKQNLNNLVRMMAELLSETDKLVKAAIGGKLETRAEAQKFVGGWNTLVAGINQTLEAVIGPLNVAAAYVDQISKGAIPAKITENYNGDFNLIKNNLNVAIDSINALVSDAAMLAQAAVEGRLGTRAEASKHQGDYRKIVDGVNQTLDLVITPINETITVLKRLAEGDLTVVMSGDYRGDFDILKKALVDSLDSFNDILGQVNTAVEQVTAGSLQVSQASQSLSQGATEQASSLEQITSSITEVAGQTKQNTENAIQVNSLAKTARDNAEQGNIQMKDLVAAMTDINASAEEIRKIVKAIDDISFQINLLALNANVEAARAGKYGKGFAVVAEEVRNLAVRSASSVKDTTRMVDEAISNIERGNSLVDVTAKQLAAIVDGAAKVATLAEEVSTASKEQTQGLEQISTGLGQIDQVTQSNTASAEESASAAEELSSQSQQLKGMLGRFVLKASDKRMNNNEMMQMLRDELAKQQGHRTTTSGAPAPVQGRGHEAARKKAPGQRVNPADLIALDDDNFGKF